MPNVLKSKRDWEEMQKYFEFDNVRTSFCFSELLSTTPENNYGNKCLTMSRSVGKMPL